MCVYWLKRYCNAVQRMPPDLTSEKKVERFLTDLATINNVAPSTQNQAFNALLYFYNRILEQPLHSVDALRASRPDHLRHAPTVAEIRALLPTVPDQAGYPTNLIARLIYGAGLRVTEPLNLRIKDLNLEKSALFIMGAKGGDDRVVPLPASLRSEIAQQIHLARATWQRDEHNHIPLLLPHQLARKSPNWHADQSQSFAPSIRTAKRKLPSQTTSGDFLIAISNHPRAQPPQPAKPIPKTLVSFQN
jgi:site-specific recombinase XerD